MAGLDPATQPLRVGAANDSFVWMVGSKPAMEKKREGLWLPSLFPPGIPVAPWDA